MKRRPNGTGSVIKLSGSRRKPYEVRGPVKGYTDKGYPIFDRIGYAETYDQGLEMLIEYNKSPYDPLERSITLSELFERWQQDELPKLGDCNQRALKGAYRHIKVLEIKSYSSITTYQMQQTIDKCGKGYSTQAAIKALWRRLDSYAYTQDVIAKKRSDELSSASVDPNTKAPYTEDEIKILWQHTDDPTVVSILILLYTGYRVTEYLSIQRSMVDFENMTIQYGIKTRAGKERIIPIHSKIQSLVLKRFEKGDYLCAETKAERLRYAGFHKLYMRAQSKYGMSHTIHETRHTFRTRLDNAGANTKCMDLLMGHASGDTGQRVYTHKTLDQLRETIELLR
ncbi:tyrosine-type recombinase/integrase [Holdemania filiformis]|nr:tyrosine-type recombinase/integrase [Holdemania filiformis]